jgi:hypothetical protein
MEVEGMLSNDKRQTNLQNIGLSFLWLNKGLF